LLPIWAYRGLFIISTAMILGSVLFEHHPDWWTVAGALVTGWSGAVLFRAYSDKVEDAMAEALNRIEPPVEKKDPELS
jgi:hypothetical protein